MIHARYWVSKTIQFHARASSAAAVLHAKRWSMECLDDASRKSRVTFDP
ncbi:hypothetical protein RMSM_06113 [Rhodopirellula maiorica SM1]|uniref:Uncharacterized protein n=1 Tax=Rhodopirellula maiorica SM1 TaxID=1265738 RepID=M5RBU5_9BACT|nr:hypothetical protein RMSM_06113 [Rhodopirellula maiorica SM1]